ncbi:tetratricopeptide repeat protein, partial [Parabacteroides faecis]
MKKYSILLVLSLICLFSTAQNDNVNKVKAVIDKYNKVTGLDKLSKNPPKTFLQESKMTSFFSDQPNISWITIIGDSENERAYMVQESSDNSKIETLFNKDRGWILTNDGTTLELDENMLSSMSKLTDFLKSSTASMTDISNMKYVETITEGKNTYNVLQLISPENSKVNMYFNERTGLLDYSISFLNEEQKKVLHTEQQKQTFNNYTQFGDVMLPDFYTENNGKIGLMFETKRISLDYPIDNVDFSENKFKLGLDAYSYYSKGLNTENDREAIELFDKAITIRPNYIDAHLARIKNYQNLNDYQSAINLCDRLLRIDDNNTSALFYRASSYLILGNYSKAKNDCKTILAYEPENKVISEFMDNIS